jgi:hypothetical protein
MKKEVAWSWPTEAGVSGTGGAGLRGEMKEEVAGAAEAVCCANVSTCSASASRSCSAAASGAEAAKETVDASDAEGAATACLVSVDAGQTAGVVDAGNAGDR